jgi:N-formylglutamate deformylase
MTRYTNVLDICSYRQANSAVIVSFPHSGTLLPADLKPRLTASGASMDDTDWHVPQLYNFLAQMDVSVVQANYSRYVVDLNRPADGGKLYPGRSETETCPTTSFAGLPLYAPGHELQAAEITGRIETYWRPYHRRLAAEIDRLKSVHGYALVWDAHSIRSEVPRFFAGKLPDLNLGTADGSSCSPELTRALSTILSGTDEFSGICNGRFKGGAITRHYGDPAGGVHAVQMEIAQSCYMSECAGAIFDEDKAAKLRPVLKQMLRSMQEVSRGIHDQSADAR